MSKDDLGRVVRAAAVSGLLGAAGLVIAAGPAHAQTDNGSGTNGSGTNGSGTNGSGATSGSTAGAATTTTVVGSGGLAKTGNSAAAPLALGGAAVGVVLAGRRLLAARA
jgi:hypothetical protein